MRYIADVFGRLVTLFYIEIVLYRYVDMVFLQLKVERERKLFAVLLVLIFK